MTSGDDDWLALVLARDPVALRGVVHRPPRKPRPPRLPKGVAQ